jgi:SpoVK/Ycf46/Vps4 family AAA+-type ATPase
VAEALAPCVLRIDEIEKAFSGAKSSGLCDGGTTARVFGAFLTWMQEKRADVFVVATANEVSQLPPELMRKGRFDETFFFDLPTPGERGDIWRAQLRNSHLQHDIFDIDKLVRASEGYVGSEIEQSIKGALRVAFIDGQRQPTTEDILRLVDEIRPLSVSHPERMEELRAWVRDGRARSASTKAAKQGVGVLPDSAHRSRFAFIE